MDRHGQGRVQKKAAGFRFEHPLGPICVWWSSRGLQRLDLPNPRQRGAAFPGCRPKFPRSGQARRFRQLHAALERYFAGRREDFYGIPLDIEDATPFQRRVWLAARNVGWGETVTYGELALRAGLPREAARAVGNALGANPIPIIIPCHRIVTASGGLGGFSAGLQWKRELLRAEGHKVHHRRWHSE